MQSALSKIAELSGKLSSPLRLNILYVIGFGEMTNMKIKMALGNDEINPKTISIELQQMVRAGILTDKKQTGRVKTYRVNKPDVIFGTLDEIGRLIIGLNK